GRWPDRGRAAHDVHAQQADELVLAERAADPQEDRHGPRRGRAVSWSEDRLRADLLGSRERAPAGGAARGLMRLAPQLERIESEPGEARRRAHEIVAPLTPEDWSTRPAGDQWSVAECFIHLNLTSRAFLPLIGDAIARGRGLKLHATGPYRRDVVGWF